MDSVEALLKKHEEFEGTSAAHDDRIRSLSEQANKLIHAGHYDTTRWEQLDVCSKFECQFYSQNYLLKFKRLTVKEFLAK